MNKSKYFPGAVRTGVQERCARWWWSREPRFVLSHLLISHIWLYPSTLQLY